MNNMLRLLVVEDSIDDANLLLATVRRAGYKVHHTVVDTGEALTAELKATDWDLITSDNAMPQFSAQAVLGIAKQLCPDVPVIIVSADVNFNTAIALMKEGASDYVQKGQLARVGPAIERVLRESNLRREHDFDQNSLQVSELRYRRLFETAQDGILILDAHTGEIMDINPFLVEMLGHSKDDVLGKKLWDIGPFKDISASQFSFKELQAKGYVRYRDLPLETKDGRQIAVEFVSNIYLVDHREVAQCNIRDISERKHADDEVRRLTAELEQRVAERTAQLEVLNQELESFSYSVSHDLRAPLRRITGFANVLREDFADRQSDESLHVIENICASVEHMSALTEALINLAHFSHIALQRCDIDLSAMAHLVAADLELGQPGRKVTFVIADGLSCQGDPALLRVVLDNLLGNAWKFTARCTAALIEFGVTTAANGSNEFFVRDNGAGFNMAYADRLFGTFQRLHHQRDFPGVGVGLATVQRIVRRHGGRIWAQSSVGQGATFYFSIGDAVSELVVTSSADTTALRHLDMPLV